MGIQFTDTQMSEIQACEERVYEMFESSPEKKLTRADVLSDLEIRKWFEIAEAIVTDSHFLYKHGEHGSAYVNKDAIYPHSTLVSLFCLCVAVEVMYRDIDIVAGPVLGGIPLSQCVSRHLSRLKGREVPAVFLEKHPDDENVFIVKRGYDSYLTPGNKVFGVEDVLNSGSSMEAVVKTLRGYGCDVIGIGALCNRGGVTRSGVGDVPILSTLLNVEMDKFDPDDCPLCRDGVPRNTQLGKWKK